MTHEIRLGLRFIANDEASRSRGLMHAEPLQENEAAFFIFPNSQRYAFWNRNVSFPIDVVFLNDLMQIVDIQNLDKHQEKAIQSQRDAKFVIEARHGAFKKLGFGIGDFAQLTPEQNSIVLKRSLNNRQGSSLKISV